MIYEASVRARSPSVSAHPVPEKGVGPKPAVGAVPRFPTPVPVSSTPSTRRSGAVVSLLFSVAIVALLALGWWQRNEYWFTAEDGWGYAFGIVGASLMLLLLLYPLRKHWKPMRQMLPIRHWFRLHMLFGIVGPVFILYHCNFSLGSLNSNVALFSMLLVASSGIVGRYVYRQIHRGLYGARIRLSDLRADYECSRTACAGNALVDEETAAGLAEIEAQLSDRSLSVIGSLRARSRLRHLRRRIARRLSRVLRLPSASPSEADTLRSAHADWRRTVGSLDRMARYAIFARLFSLWHVLHLPIFLMMLAAATVHVIVVHMY